ncbi:MAG: DUF3106 domain-containing protein [Bryobacterales bacterium]|nr:DUF3106 domain-containing protein [Bryobacterales bacterium]MBV9401460.1 DUF3106 domain-containing protein [Bryobacterales bacterium]
MKCLACRIALLVCLCAPAWAQPKNKAPAKLAPRPAVMAPKAAKQINKQSNKQIPRSIPGKQIEQLRKMSPEERQRALSNLPPERRQQVEKQLDRLDKLPPEQRQVLDQRYEKLQSFPPPRQRAVRQELQSLRSMPFAERQARLHSDEFKQQFSPEERELIQGVFPGAAR